MFLFVFQKISIINLINFTGQLITKFTKKKLFRENFLSILRGCDFQFGELILKLGQVIFRVDLRLH